MGWVEGVVAVVVALIGAGWFKRSKTIERKADELREENTSQHAENAALLCHVSSQVATMHEDMVGFEHRASQRLDALDERLDAAIEWQHAHELDHITQAKLELRVVGVAEGR